MVQGESDAAIDAKGRVLAVWSGAPTGGFGLRLVCGRMFDPSGSPIGGSFFVSEVEDDLTAAADLYHWLRPTQVLLKQLLHIRLGYPLAEEL